MLLQLPVDGCVVAQDNAVEIAIIIHGLDVRTPLVVRAGDVKAILATGGRSLVVNQANPAVSIQERAGNEAVDIAHPAGRGVDVLGDMVLFRPG